METTQTDAGILRQFKNSKADSPVFPRSPGISAESRRDGRARHAGSKDALRALLPRLLPLLKPYRSRQIEILCCLALAAACSVAIPLLVKYALKDFQAFFRQDHFTSADAVLYFRQTTLRYVGALACIYALSALVTLRRADAVRLLNQSVLTELQLRLFARLQRLPDSFYTRAKMGDLMTCLTGDIEAIQSALSQLTNKSLYQMFLLAGGILGLLLSSGFSLLTLLILLIVPLFAGTYTGLRARNKAAGREQRRQVGQTAATAQEYLSAQAVIKAFGMEEYVIADYRARLLAQMRAKLRLTRLAALADVSEDLATALAQLLILGLGGYLMLVRREGAVRIEDLVASLLLVKYIIEPVAALSTIGQNVQQASGAMERMNDLFEEPIPIADRPDANILPPLTEAIRLEGVTFGYTSEQPILQDLNLRIAAGTHVAIVGPTGGGKSTFLKLLLRFWDPLRGRVFFDGHDLRDVTLASLRGQIGLVFQDTLLFDRTLRDNIAVGRPEAGEAEIIAAARAAQLEADIQAMPAGYETVLGERGVCLSGGQRQRLAIARALLRDPRLLILDEAGSALDAQTEANLLQTLSRLKQDRTVISVTHRLAWAQAADRILVIAGGRLVEDGTHSQLLASGGLYRKLYEEQMRQGSPRE